MVALAFGVHDDFTSHTRQSSQTDVRELENNEIDFVNGQFAFLAPLVPYLPTISTVAAFP